MGLKINGIKELEQKLALGTSKKLGIVDMSQNCGAIGIAVAQLVPDVNVSVLDDAEALPTIKQNVHLMHSAMSASVTVEDWSLDEASGNTGRPADIVFVTASRKDDDAALRAIQVLRILLARSPRALVVVMKEAEEGDVQNADQASIISDLLKEHRRALCGRERLPGGSKYPQYDLMVFRGGTRR